jgi:hypothetical protein
MKDHTLRRTIAGITVLLSTLTAAWVATTASTERSSDDLPEAHDDVPVLTGDVTPEVRKLVAVVVDAARQHGVPLATQQLEINSVDRVEPASLVGGRTDGKRIVVGCNVASPQRTLLHEVAHAAVGIQYEHGEPWRSVYITAFSEVFGERRAERELRRVEWVYDKSYLETRTP